jgi:hypothetical protein
MPGPDESVRDDGWTRDLEWIDAVADRFEAAWQGGAPPLIRDFVGPETGACRSALVAELVKIDQAYRRGEHPGLEDYLGDFPELLTPDAPATRDTALSPDARRVAHVAETADDCAVTVWGVGNGSNLARRPRRPRRP